METTDAENNTNAPAGADSATFVADAPDEGGKPEAGRSIRKKLPQPLEQVMKEVAPEAGASGGTMARLERRVFVLERAFADIVERHEKSVRDRSGALAAVETGLNALKQTMEQSGSTHRQSVGELHKKLNDALMRVNALEAGTPAAETTARENSAPAFAIDEAPPMLLTDEASSETGAEPADEAEAPVALKIAEPPPKAESPAYLSSARRAALAAAQSQQDETRAVEAPERKRPNRIRLLLMGGVAPAIVIAVGLFALNRHTVTAQPAPAPARKVTQLTLLPSPAPQVAALAVQNPTPTETATAVPVDELMTRAKAGDAQAQRDLGLKYLSGDGADMNEAEAARWLMEAAYAGEPNAEYWLGTLYARGHGVPADAFQANHWYEAAAKDGNRRAMHSFAVANFEGLGMEKNSAEAARWFTKAAELGLVDSQFDLAVLYERGSGVEKNLAEAYKWYAIAAKAGDKEADARVAALAKDLKPADLTLAQQAAASFKPAPVDRTANAAASIDAIAAASKAGG